MRRLHLKEAWELAQMADPIVPFAVRCAAELGVADLLGEPAPVVGLARKLGVDDGALLRLMRTLACRGVFEEVEDGVFAQTRLSSLLTRDHPLRARDALALIPVDTEAWAHVDHAVRTGRSAFEHALGEPYYAWMAHHPEERAKVDRTVDAVAELVARTLAGAYPWESLGTVVDVGSGTGRFTLALLERFAGLRAVLFDLPAVASAARTRVAELDLTDRCTVVDGDYFEGLPGGAGGYLLKSVLHDWADEPARALLRRVVEAMEDDARAVIVEAVLAPDNAFDFGKLMDLHSLVLAGGPDRTLAELEALLDSAGLEVVAVRPSGHALVVVEARKRQSGRCT